MAFVGDLGTRTGFQAHVQEIVTSEISDNTHKLPVLFAGLTKLGGAAGNLGRPGAGAILGTNVPNDLVTETLRGSSQKHIRFNPGNTISGKFLTENGTTSSAGNENQHDAIRTARVSWTYYDHPIRINNMLLRQARDKYAFGDLMMESTKIAVKDMIETLSPLVYTGNPSNHDANVFDNFVGLDQWVHDGNNVVGVNRASVNGFSGVRVTTAKQATLSLIDDAMLIQGLASKFADLRLWLTNETLYNKLKQEAIAKNALIQSGGQTDGALVGFRNEFINYNGKIITFDPFAPANTVYGLDPETWRFEIDPNDNFRVGRFKNWAEEGHQGDPDVTESFIRLGGRLYCTVPGRNIVYTNVS